MLYQLLNNSVNATLSFECTSKFLLIETAVSNAKASHNQQTINYPTNGLVMTMPSSKTN